MEACSTLQLYERTHARVDRMFGYSLLRHCVMTSVMSVSAISCEDLFRIWPVKVSYGHKYDLLFSA